MAIIFKNPELEDYFVERTDVTLDTPIEDIEPIVEQYEAGKVISFPNLKLGINHAAWAALSTDEYPGLKKLKSEVGEPRAALEARIGAAGLPPDKKAELTDEISRLCDGFIPIYQRLFEGYRFQTRRVVWRLTATRNENLHIDTYRAPQPTDHFARIFMNLDIQPRIWTTSYTFEQLHHRFGGKLSSEQVRGMDAGTFRVELNKIAFGGAVAKWYDNQPRHVIYFDPGDVWAVDSRRIAHQIFYGRRAASFDFSVEPASMRDPAQHYLRMAEHFRTALLAEAA